MWKIKVLKGPNNISNFDLKFGDNILGRSPNCDICIPSPGLSKQHAKITISDNGVYITDQGSTNGTFVNGIKITSQRIKVGDRIGLFDVLLTIEKQAQKEIISPDFTSGTSISGNLTSGNLALKPDGFPQSHGQSVPVSQIEAPKDLASLSQTYVENVMLPGVYKLAEVIEFKWLVGLFIIVFAVITTSFAVIPMLNITKESIQVEGQRRALSIARSIVLGYERAVQDGTEGTFSSRIIDREPGVQRYFIVSSTDGTVLAPPSSAGRRPDEPFVHTARKSDQEITSQISSELIGAAIPIKSLDKETGSIRVFAHAVVLYNIGALAVSSDRIISLFVQVLLITLVTGALIYFFLYKLIEYPIKVISHQVDQALQNGQTHAQVNYLFPELQNLISNINTLINRMSTQNRSENTTDRSQEAFQLVEKYPLASIAIDANNTIVAYNNDFSNLVGLAGQRLSGQTINSLNDQALILNFSDLISSSITNGHTSEDSELEFNGKFMQIVLVPIFDEKGVKYYFIFFKNKETF